jgi:hypothetical protein
MAEQELNSNKGKWSDLNTLLNSQQEIINDLDKPIGETARRNRFEIEAEEEVKQKAEKKAFEDAQNAKIKKVLESVDKAIKNLNKENENYEKAKQSFKSIQATNPLFKLNSQYYEETIKIADNYLNVSESYKNALDKFEKIQESINKEIAKLTEELNLKNLIEEENKKRKSQLERSIYSNSEYSIADINYKIAKSKSDNMEVANKQFETYLAYYKNSFESSSQVKQAENLKENAKKILIPILNKKQEIIKERERKREEEIRKENKKKLLYLAKFNEEEHERNAIEEFKSPNSVHQVHNFNLAYQDFCESCNTNGLFDLSYKMNEFNSDNYSRNSENYRNNKMTEHFSNEFEKLDAQIDSVNNNYKESLDKCFEKIKFWSDIKKYEESEINRGKKTEAESEFVDTLKEKGEEAKKEIIDTRILEKINKKLEVSEKYKFISGYKINEKKTKLHNLESRSWFGKLYHRKEIANIKVELKKMNQFNQAIEKDLIKYKREMIILHQFKNEENFHETLDTYNSNREQELTEDETVVFYKAQKHLEVGGSSILQSEPQIYSESAEVSNPSQKKLSEVLRHIGISLGKSNYRMIR